MSDQDEYRCFIGGLAWSTSDRGLKEAFEKFGRLVEAKVVLDKFSGRSRGFGFVSFDDKKAMDDAIEEMNGVDLDGRAITVDKAQPNQGGSGRDRDGDRDRDRGGRDRDGDRRGGRGSGGDCFKCGKPGHFARECPSGDGERGGGRYSGNGREDRYGGGGGGGSRYGPDRGGDRGGDRGSDRSRDRGGDRGGERGGDREDRYSSRSRDSGSRGGSDRYSRDRSGPYSRD